MRSLRAATAAVIAIASVAAAASGPALDYTLNCEGCHRADGTGTPGSVPALRDSVARFLAAPGGREYLARVPGVAQAPLDDAALAAVLNWLLEHFDHAHVPPGFAPYSADEVGRLRKQPLVDVEGTRARLLGRRSANDGRHDCVRSEIMRAPFGAESHFLDRVPLPGGGNLLAGHDPPRVALRVSRLS